MSTSGGAAAFVSWRASPRPCGVADSASSWSGASYSVRHALSTMFFAGSEDPQQSPRVRRLHRGRGHSHSRFPAALEGSSRSATSFVLDCTADEPYGLDFRVFDPDARESFTNLCAKYREQFSKKHMVSNLKLLASNCPNTVHFWIQSSNMMVNCCVPTGQEGQVKCEVAEQVNEPSGLFEKLKHATCTYTDPQAVLLKSQSTETSQIVKTLTKILGVLAMFTAVGEISKGFMDAALGIKDGKFYEPCPKGPEPCSISNIQGTFSAMGSAVMAFMVIRKLMAYSCVSPGGTPIDAGHTGEVQARHPYYGLQATERVVLLEMPVAGGGGPENDIFWCAGELSAKLERGAEDGRAAPGVERAGRGDPGDEGTKRDQKERLPFCSRINGYTASVREVARQFGGVVGSARGGSISGDDSVCLRSRHIGEVDSGGGSHKYFL